jgi:predicted DNA-binding protein (UPF0251 family)
MWQAVNAAVARIVDAAMEPAAETVAGGPDAVRAGSKAAAKKRKRRRNPIKGIRLTEKQVEAMHLVGEHKGNFAAAAKATGKSRQAMSKLYRKANQKLGKQAIPKPKTQALPTDHRGQAIVPHRD